MSVRQVKKFRVSKKAEPVYFYPDENRCHRVQDWGVEIGVCMTSTNMTSAIGPFTLSDLLRLRRVINRAIKIVSNSKNQCTKSLTSYEKGMAPRN